MPFSLADVSNEVFLRIDQGDDPSMPKLKKGGVYEISKAIFDVMGQAVAAGEDVSIPQFGKFVRHLQGPRTARNPKTGEKIKVKPKYVVKFRASSVIRQNLANIKVAKSSKKK